MLFLLAGFVNVRRPCRRPRAAGPDVGSAQSRRVPLDRVAEPALPCIGRDRAVALAGTKHHRRAPDPAR
jgi:hypothetical protein